MKTWKVIIAGALVLMLSGLTYAGSLTITEVPGQYTKYCEELQINENINAFFGFPINPACYEHTNPYESAGGFTEAEWAAIVAEGKVGAVKLTLDMSGVGLLEAATVKVQAAGSSDWTYVGIIFGDAPTTFDLLQLGPDGGLNGLPVKVGLWGFDGSGYKELGANAVLETSKLCVKIVPLPAAAWAGMMMLGSMGILRKLRHR